MQITSRIALPALGVEAAPAANMAAGHVKDQSPDNSSDQTTDFETLLFQSDHAEILPKTNNGFTLAPSEKHLSEERKPAGNDTNLAETSTSAPVGIQGSASTCSWAADEVELSGSKSVPAKSSKAVLSAEVLGFGTTDPIPTLTNGAVPEDEYSPSAAAFWNRGIEGESEGSSELPQARVDQPTRGITPVHDAAAAIPPLGPDAQPARVAGGEVVQIDRGQSDIAPRDGQHQTDESQPIHMSKAKTSANLEARSSSSAESSLALDSENSRSGVQNAQQKNSQHMEASDFRPVGRATDALANPIAERQPFLALGGPLPDASKGKVSRSRPPNLANIGELTSGNPNLLGKVLGPAELTDPDELAPPPGTLISWNKSPTSRENSNADLRTLATTSAGMPAPSVVYSPSSGLLISSTILTSAEGATPTAAFAEFEGLVAPPSLPIQLHVLTPPAGLDASLPGRANSIWVQISEGIVKAAGENVGSHTELTLSPEELGRVRFEVTTIDDRTTIRLFAERPETLDLLRRSADSLMADLRQAGLPQGSLSFGNWNQSKPTTRPSKDKTASAGEVALSQIAAPSSRFPTATVMEGRLHIRL